MSNFIAKILSWRSKIRQNNVAINEISDYIWWQIRKNKTKLEFVGNSSENQGFKYVDIFIKITSIKCSWTKGSFA